MSETSPETPKNSDLGQEEPGDPDKAPPSDDRPRHQQAPRLTGSSVPGPKIPPVFIYLFLILGGVLVFETILMGSMTGNQLRYDLFLKHVKAGEVKKVKVGLHEITGEFNEELEIPGIKEGSTLKTKTFTSNRVHEHRELIPLLDEYKVEIEGSPDNSAMVQIMLWGGLFVFMLVIWYFIFKRLNPQRSAKAFGRSKARIIAENEIAVRFTDVAGIDEAKEELQELILFLKDAERFERLGAHIPRGVLLVGPPGTGKTLLAKAVAGEAGVPFYSLSGSDFVEMFAGVGASRVRNLFSQAHKNSPCIVFIDELDAIGKARGGGHSGAHDEREQTLNQLLAELDGFETETGVIMLAATNRPEILDPALLRPGRFDRQVSVDRPDLQGRREILKVHAKKITMKKGIDLEQVAKTTPGFAGADLANLVNEAALMAARHNKEAVEGKDFEAAFERIVAGLEKRQRILRPQEKRRVSIHEVGHALVALARESSDPVHRISIISRGAAALGYTMQLPVEDRFLLTMQELEDRMDVMLGGRVAEKVILGDLSTGASDDLNRAVQLARRMVKEFGMSDKLGPTAFANSPKARYLDGSDAGPRQYSEETAREIDQEIRKMINASESRVSELLSKAKDALLKIADILFEKETLDHEELLEVAISENAPVHPSKTEAGQKTAIES